MPARIQRKTEDASYGRERYLAKEYIKKINSKIVSEEGNTPVISTPTAQISPEKPVSLSAVVSKLTKGLPDSEK